MASCVRQIVNANYTRHERPPCVVPFIYVPHYLSFNTLCPRQNWRHFADDIFKCIFVDENVWIPIKISMKFVLKGPINNIPTLVQIMAWRPPGDKPLSEPMMVSLPTHICVARLQWVKPFRVEGNENFFFIRWSTTQRSITCRVLDEVNGRLLRLYWLTIMVRLPKNSTLQN